MLCVIEELKTDLKPTETKSTSDFACQYRYRLETRDKSIDATTTFEQLAVDTTFNRPISVNRQSQTDIRMQNFKPDRSLLNLDFTHNEPAPEFVIVEWKDFEQFMLEKYKTKSIQVQTDKTSESWSYEKETMTDLNDRKQVETVATQTYFSHDDKATITSPNVEMKSTQTKSLRLNDQQTMTSPNKEVACSKWCQTDIANMFAASTQTDIFYSRQEEKETMTSPTKEHEQDIKPERLYNHNLYWEDKATMTSPNQEFLKPKSTQTEILYRQADKHTLTSPNNEQIKSLPLTLYETKEKATMISPNQDFIRPVSTQTDFLNKNWNEDKHTMTSPVNLANAISVSSKNECHDKQTMTSPSQESIRCKSTQTDIYSRKDNATTTDTLRVQSIHIQTDLIQQMNAEMFEFSANSKAYLAKMTKVLGVESMPRSNQNESSKDSDEEENNNRTPIVIIFLNNS